MSKPTIGLRLRPLRDGTWHASIDGEDYQSLGGPIAQRALRERGVGMDRISEISGNLMVLKTDTLYALSEVSGNVIIADRAASWNAPNLKVVNGDVAIRGDAANNSLTKVGGNLALLRNAEANGVTSVVGDLMMDQARARKLLAVGGTASVDRYAELPNLRFIGGRIEAVSDGYRAAHKIVRNPVNEQALIGIGKSSALMSALDWSRRMERQIEAKAARITHEERQAIAYAGPLTL